MVTVRSCPAVGLAAQLVLLAALAVTVGQSGLAWAVGLASGVGVSTVAARGLARRGARVLGPADLVTLTRAAMTCAVAGLVVDSLFHRPAATAVVVLSATALALDAVDGWVARRTGTTSAFGAKFDGEVDAFLILVLSVYVAPDVGVWVLAIGAMRYAFAVAGWGLPWMRRRLEFLYWRKVVAATQGIVLVVAAAQVLPAWLTTGALAVALAVLAESFARDVVWLWRRREVDPRPVGRFPLAGPAWLTRVPRRAEHGRPAVATPAARRRRTLAAGTLNVLAFLLVWFALVAPNQAYQLTPAAFLRIPVEGLVLAVLALVLPAWGRRVTAAAAGVLLGLLSVMKLLDIGFFAAFDRPFNLVTDRGYLHGGVDLLQGSIGSVGATVALVGVAVLVLALLVGMPLSVARMTGLVARHRATSLRAVAVLTAFWLGFSMAGVRLVPGEPVASMDSAHAAVGQVRAISNGVRDDERFETATASDRFRRPVGRDLLGGLRGKDVLLVFIESYGRTAIEGSPASSQVRTVLDRGTRRLRAAGYSSRSAFLTSPTFGGLSWLAHATLQSGLWVDNQPRYDQLLSSDRMSLTRAFGSAGWRTVAAMSQNDRWWPQGKAFYRFDRIYYRWDYRYAGPRFGFATVPDQYVLDAFRRSELAGRDRAPVMAQIDLVSSHAPWATLPRMVDWSRLGETRLFTRMHERAGSKEQLWSNPAAIEPAYLDAIAYSLRSTLSFVQRYGNEDLVVVLLGDHQPATVVTGHGATHDVPITVIARDPAVMDQISSWGWQEGLRPDAEAPVWPMDAFRDRFLAAYSPPRSPDASPPSHAALSPARVGAASGTR